MPELRMVAILLVMGYVLEWGYSLPPVVPWLFHLMGICSGTVALGAILTVMLLEAPVTNGDWSTDAQE